MTPFSFAISNAPDIVKGLFFDSRNLCRSHYRKASSNVWKWWLYEKLDKDSHNNAILNAKSLADNAEGNIIRADKGKLVVIDGLSDYIIVDKEDVLLIYPKDKEQDIKQIQKRVKAKYGD